MKVRRIYLPVETNARELDGKLLLALHLVSRGATVTIGRKRPVIDRALQIGHGHLLYKDHSPLARMLVEQLVNNGVAVSALDEEGLLFDRSQYWKRADASLGDLLTKVFVWGSELDRALREVAPGLRRISVATGSPRIDLLQPWFRPYRNLLAQLAGSPEGHIQINLSSPAANWNSKQYGTPDYLAHMKSRGFVKGPSDEIQIRKKIEDTRFRFQSIVRLVEQIHQRYPDVTVVVRPHPDENMKSVRRALQPFKGLSVSRRGSVLGFAERSLLCISTNCTTGVEAGLMGKPSLNYDPLGARNQTEISSLTTVPAKTIDEALDWIAIARSHSFPTATDEDAIGGWISESRTGRASEVIAAELLDALPGHNDGSTIFPVRSRITGWRSEQLKRMRVALDENRDGKNTAERSQDIRRRLRVLNRIVKGADRPCFRLRTLFPNLWELEPSDDLLRRAG